MGHLGEGTEITTVQDKEIVLTASNGQHFRMKIADLAEAVRQVMPVATSDRNGLANNGFFRLRYIIISNSNLNDINDSGIYLNTTGNGSGNSNYPTNYGILLVFKFEESYSAQVSIGINELTHIRLKFDGNWSEWRLISFIK